ncbi:MAG: hypothetical protein R2852_05100 [Bacteroidia bacterium]
MGVDQEPQIQALKRKVDILSTCVECFDLISQGYIDVKNLETLVIDLSGSYARLPAFLQDIKDVLRHIPRERTCFFATNDKIRKLAYSIVKNVIRIQISPDNPKTKTSTILVAH